MCVPFKEVHYGFDTSVYGTPPLALTTSTFPGWSGGFKSNALHWPVWAISYGGDNRRGNRRDWIYGIQRFKEGRVKMNEDCVKFTTKTCRPEQPDRRCPAAYARDALSAWAYSH